MYFNLNVQFMSGLDPQQTQSQPNQSATPSQGQQSQGQSVGQSHDSPGKSGGNENSNENSRINHTELKMPDFSLLGPFASIFETLFQVFQRIIRIISQVVQSSASLG